MPTPSQESPRKQQPKQPGGPGGKGRRPLRQGRLVLWLVAMGLLGYLAWSALGMGGPEGPEIAYTEFREQVRSGNVSRVEVKGQRLTGTLQEPAMHQDPQGQAARYTDFVTYLPSFGDDALMGLLEDRGVEVVNHPSGESSWLQILITIAPFVILGWIFLMFMRGMRGRGQQLFNIGKSQAKLYERRNGDTSFDDVAGCEGAKGELREVVSFLKEPEKFHKLGGKVPKGVLLVGPPGTGKTLLARAVAGEAEVPFYSITGSDFMEMFVGVGASRVRDLFKTAKKSAPSIIFIDELDSIGRRRGAGLGGGHDEREQTLNQLLSELDGFEPTESVIVMGATNRPDILDPALLRPGRFDRRITVHRPSLQDRLAILRIHARKKPLADDVDLGRLAQGTPGLSGADLENVLNEAALLAARKEHERITDADLDEARDKVLMGLERSGLVLDEEEKRLLAYHEAGHALVAAALPHTDPIHKVTIVPRGRAMGVTQQLPEKDKYIYRREYMLDRVAVMMGGRAAEDLAFDTATSGAENDLEEATKLARKMVLRWGMSDEIGPMASSRRREQVFLGEEIAQKREFSEETQREVDQAVRRIVVEAYDRASATLSERRDVLDRVAEALVEKEELSGDAVMELLNGRTVDVPPEGAPESAVEENRSADGGEARATG